MSEWIDKIFGDMKLECPFCGRHVQAPGIIRKPAGDMDVPVVDEDGQPVSPDQQVEVGAEQVQCTCRATVEYDEDLSDFDRNPGEEVFIVWSEYFIVRSEYNEDIVHATGFVWRRKSDLAERLEIALDELLDVVMGFLNKTRSIGELRQIAQKIRRERIS